MPIRPQRSFEHEANLEEPAGFGKNRRFDAVVDDEDVEAILSARFRLLVRGCRHVGGCGTCRVEEEHMS
ncbi:MULTISPECIES: 2Fe-2S iron-sulfur cluster-binding protein [unclassified Thiocapsa]|uniref:2Fe-2S iron-sulfur cluster-binding protein n=1 Tax=unclassified Thiocapsa TaxID=2641286 RepID=UPI0035AEB33F